MVTKAELTAEQAASPPFGNYLVPESEVFHIHGTSGTTGRPTTFASAAATGGRSPCPRADHVGYGDAPWRHRLRRRDFQPLCRELGSPCRRRAARSEGLSVRRRGRWNDRALRAMARHAEAGSVLWHPTYALTWPALRSTKACDPRGFGLRAMFFSGEPGASIPAVRGKIEELYGAKVFDCGSMGEMTPWMNVAGWPRPTACCAGRTSFTPRFAIP